MKKTTNSAMLVTPNPELFDPQLWTEKTLCANQNFADNKLALANQQYLETQNIAKQLFSYFKNYHPVPDALTPILVISYLNLADCRAKQHKQEEQISDLFEIYVFLKSMLRDSLISEKLSLQIYQGIGKIHPHLYLCLKQGEHQNASVQLKESFSEITTKYQAQTWALH